MPKFNNFLNNQVYGLGFFLVPASLPRNALSAKKADCRVFALFSFFYSVRLTQQPVS